ncbi:hypothetical protein GCM10009821_22420 [Aeromicrobium halocynthiae]|uniref:Uncharacterized protein n=1 Tax=Aeromicrobium halocynthiae TaxID=560557 RepID=A0ABN2W1X4_9ACTN
MSAAKEVTSARSVLVDGARRPVCAGREGDGDSVDGMGAPGTGRHYLNTVQVNSVQVVCHRHGRPCGQTEGT